MQREPLTQVVGFKAEEHLGFTRNLVKDAFHDGFSLVAEDAISGALVGFSLSEDLAKPTPPPFSKQYEPIVCLLESLSEDHKNRVKQLPNRTLHIVMIGVSEAYCRNGLATRLVSENISLAKRLGFTSAAAEATALYSQKLFSSLGFYTEKDISYADFKMAETFPFKDIIQPIACKFMVKSLVES